MPQVRDAQGRFTKAVASPNGPVAKQRGITNELGRAGDTRAGARLYEDFLPQLRGRSGLRVYEEMRSNDPVIAGYLYAIEMTVRRVPWRVEPHPDGDEGDAEFLEANMRSMSHTWEDFLSDVLSMLAFGWSFFEIVYRLQDGDVWWRKLVLQHHGNFIQWELGDDGGIEGLTEATPTGTRVTIPITKALLFQLNPQRRPLLRTAYRPWFFRKRLQEIEAIGASRDLTGLPVGFVPSEVLLAGSGDAQYEALKDIVTKTKRDEQEGLLWPSDRDDQGNLLFDFKLVSSGGERAFDTSQIISRYAQEILMSVMSTWLALGQTAVGSRALGEPLLRVFHTALEALLDIVESVVNRHGVTRLFALNGKTDNLPAVRHGEVSETDLAGLADFLLKTAQAGMPWFGVEGDNLEDQLRDMAGLEPPPEDMAVEKTAGYTARYDPFRKLWV